MSRMRLSVGALLALAIVATTLAGCGRRGLIRVNGEKIKKNEFYSRLERVPVQTPQGTQLAGRYIVQQMISEKLIQQLAKDQKVEPTEEQIKKKIDFLKKQSGGDMNKALAQRGLTLDDLKRQITVEQAFVNVVTKGISVPDDKVRKAYDEALNAKNSTLIRPEQVMVSAIITSSKPKIDKAHKLLSNGQEFSAVAQQISDEEVWVKNTAGRMGWASRDGNIDLVLGRKATFGEDFAKRVFALGVGKFSAPFKSADQWVILRADRKRDKKITKYDEIKDVIREQLMMQEGAKKGDYRKEMQTFTKNADITINNSTYKDIAEAIKKEASKALEAATRKPGTPPGTAPTPGAATPQ